MDFAREFNAALRARQALTGIVYVNRSHAQAGNPPFRKPWVGMVVHFRHDPARSHRGPAERRFKTFLHL